MPSTDLVNSNPSCGNAQPIRNWPNHVRFIRSQCYHSSVPSSVCQHIQGFSLSPSQLSRISPSRNLKVVIRRINQPGHPAFGQFGLFAGQKIPPKCHIIYYLGEVHCDDRPDSDYDLSLCRLSDDINVGIDANIVGNQARFVNDYRGIASKPNAVFVDGRTSCGELCMSIWSSTQEITKGEEILVSYGKSWWRSRFER